MLVKSEHSSLIWKTSANVLPVHIPELVKQVAQHDGKYLIYRNEYILKVGKQLSIYKSASDEVEQIMRISTNHELISCIFLSDGIVCF